ncbi:unnamed protein product [Linum tenue]|uniref:Uncharacterized protein n=1 Tax=Linum tenue TaxID=586396 RepID=A0AAV0LHD6_9ROSI|nr:unnamed protein product [Linum tenue]
MATTITWPPRLAPTRLLTASTLPPAAPPAASPMAATSPISSVRIFI